MNKKQIKNYVLNRYTWLYSLFHPVEKKILLSSFGGKQYSDNPRAISEAIHTMYPEYTLVWQLKDVKDEYGIIPNYISIVPKGRLSFYRELATSFCYVTNEAITPNYYKRKKQFFINTWHGDRTFKKIAYEEFPDADDSYTADSRMTDLCIAGSEYGERTYRTAFRYNGRVLNIGTPRCDKLISCTEEDIKIIRDRFPQLAGKKILLYAPTFRDNLNNKQSVSIDFNSLLNILCQNGDEWVCLIRAHSSSKGLDISFDGIKYIDVSSYQDMADLLLISDMLITDYSASAGDFILVDKPVILAMFDYEEYCKNCRELKIDPYNAHFMVAKNQEELESIISSLTAEKVKASCNMIKEYYGSFCTVSAFLGSYFVGHLNLHELFGDPLQHAQHRILFSNKRQ